ncbi:tRNA 2-thiouridine(34) synthase MnmA [Chlorobium phaeobacteroides]|uniref:tRNA-specific 2-thiouridylase MnmA n=1 Tax=Chlorobium phaeobacteroides (strain DSM 266 / SMG 266 / 2430) TaxID=290317 RepID=MNMA_CHLPD|nr:tRNA 2-thiouridine(34) synthase MnmA [Chlorobium phaeobacteroides]A1BI85.1 RecName: Full=tRNA-specific 2-thiouridylase MnmA [Chlorobium phaeobacteroides DSM 266]ABL66112.1 tRNA (5-methylaminomethyl-2-thiouridylate)-methyltransferase [Chlorobium phaeobacteroides DSM 266]
MTETVVVGISGGVDSAVAACLLMKQGYRVLGLNIRILDTPDEHPSLAPSPLLISDHADYQFPVFSLNLSARFSQEVIRYFQADYLAGKTPNPCMVCNKKIKWHGLLEGARLLGAERIATGHYARTASLDGRVRLYKGLDPQKDQSYFLWMLSQNDLNKTCFPLGELAKEKVRELARTFGVRAAEKKESQEICFVPHDDYCRYLELAVPGLKEKVAGGDIVDENGKVLGKHRGYPFYTIGQRRGLGLSSTEPLYVTALDQENNCVHTGNKSSLDTRSLTVSGLNWINNKSLDEPVEAFGKIRYRDRETPCTIAPLPDGQATITFHTAKHAVAPGQAAVFYHDEEVLGGGFISAVNRDR